MNSTTYRLAYCSVISSVQCSTFSTNNDTMYDYALLTIAASAGLNTKVFRINGVTPNTTANYRAAGYSGESSVENDSPILNSPNTLKYDLGKLDKIESNYLRAKRSDIDLEAGMSGGPLMVINTSNQYVAIGIISRARTILFTNYVYFCYINSTLYNFCCTNGDVTDVTTSMYLTN